MHTIFTFLESIFNGLNPAKSLNQASTVVFERAVAGQKLSFGFICNRLRPVSMSVFNSSFLLMIALKKAPIFDAVILKFRAVPCWCSSDMVSDVVNPCLTLTVVSSS